MSTIQFIANSLFRFPDPHGTLCVYSPCVLDFVPRSFCSEVSVVNMTKNSRVPSRYTHSSVLYWPLLLPTFIRGVGATSTHFLLKVTFAKLSAFFLFLTVLFLQGATRHSNRAWEFVLHLVPASLTFFSVSYFDSRCHNNATTVCLLCSRPLAATTFLTLQETPVLPIRNLPSTTCPALPSTIC